MVRCARLGLALISLTLPAWGARSFQMPLPPTEDSFLETTRLFLQQENLNPKKIHIELRSLDTHVSDTSGHWRALAEVNVDEMLWGGPRETLVFDRAYWLSPDAEARFAHHRWVKLMWHECHHLKQFPRNLKRARSLAKKYPPMDPKEEKDWKRKWVLLLEPLEEAAAERSCLERYRAAYGPVPEPLMNDSRGDMRKHAARYQIYFEDVISHARHPETIRRAFPSQLPVDSDGNLL